MEEESTPVLEDSESDHLSATVTNIVGSIQTADTETLADEMTTLRAKVSDLEASNATLMSRVRQLQQQLTLTAPEPINAEYTFDQFMLALTGQLGRTYGCRTDYAQASQVTPGSRPVSTDDIQKWQKVHRVPDWAYDQITVLHYSDRIGRNAPDWQPDEVGYLIALYEANPHETNASLAEKCSRNFSRDITESAIRGIVYRLGKKGRLPQHRPTK